MTETEEAKTVTRADFEAFIEAVRKELLSIEKETVSREEFGALKDAVGGIQKQLMEQPQYAKFYGCRGEGCGYQTDDVGWLIDHMIDERLGERSESAPKGHRSIEELLACPTCSPKAEEALLKAGWVKASEKKPDGDTCPDCGTKLVKPLLERPYCPKCRRDKHGTLF